MSVVARPLGEGSRTRGEQRSKREKDDSLFGLHDNLQFCACWGFGLNGRATSGLGPIVTGRTSPLRVEAGEQRLDRLGPQRDAADDDGQRAGRDARLVAAGPEVGADHDDRGPAAVG